MKNQFTVAFFKLRRFLLMYFAIIILAIFGALWGYQHLAALEGYNSLYGAFLASNSDTSCIFLLSLVSAWFIGSDFGNRTIQHEIKFGYSRACVVLVRAAAVFGLAVLLHFCYIAGTMFGTGIRAGFSWEGFGGRDILWCAVIALQLVAFQSIIVWIVFLIRKFAAAITISVCFAIISCNMIRTYTDAELFRISVFCLVQDSSDKTLLSAGIFAAAVLAVMSVATYFTFRRAEVV